MNHAKHDHKTAARHKQSWRSRERDFKRAGWDVPTANSHVQRRHRLAGESNNVPRRFANPIFALNVLRDVGITIGQFDFNEWSPAVKEEIARNRGRAEAMRKALQIAYTEWLNAEIEEAIDDSRPTIPHAEVISWMDAHIFSSKDSGTARK